MKKPKTFPSNLPLEHPKTVKPNLHRAFREAKKARKLLEKDQTK